MASELFVEFHGSLMFFKQFFVSLVLSFGKAASESESFEKMVTKDLMSSIYSQFWKFLPHSKTRPDQSLNLTLQKGQMLVLGLQRKVIVLLSCKVLNLAVFVDQLIDSRSIMLMAVNQPLS